MEKKMKKNLIIGGVVLIGVYGVCEYIDHTDMFEKNVHSQSIITNNIAGTLSASSAKELLVEHLAITDSEDLLNCELFYNGATVEYLIKCENEEFNYEYSISASNGSIIDGVTTEIVTQQNDNEENSDGSSSSGDITNSIQSISEASAKAVALKHAGVSSSEVVYTKVELDYDNGSYYYEIEFVTSTKEYEYEISKSDGSIISFDTEVLKTTSSNTNTNVSTKYITEASAKAIALKHAGVSESDITKFEIELDYDSGVVEYEIEFNVGNKEYEYEINAITGSVIKYDVDYDN